MITAADQKLIDEARRNLKHTARPGDPLVENLRTMIDLCELYLDSGALSSWHVASILNLEDQ